MVNHEFNSSIFFSLCRTRSLTELADIRRAKVRLFENPDILICKLLKKRALRNLLFGQ
jgi:hypothetical protein